MICTKYYVLEKGEREGERGGERENAPKKS